MTHDTLKLLCLIVERVGKSKIRILSIVIRLVVSTNTLTSILVEEPVALSAV
jgi:hypothetical protein